MSNFGIIVPGRKVDTNFQQVEQNKFLITIADAGNLNHVVIFLTGLTPLPPNAACCLFFSLPDPNAPPNWNYLGYLNIEKQSAIFKLSNLTKSNNMIGDNGLAVAPSATPVFNYAQAPVVSVAQIGISIEPIESVIHMVPAVDTSASNVTSIISFMNKTVENLYNYCASFAQPASDIALNAALTPATQFVPLNSIQTWYENYSKRLQFDQNFWRNLN